MSNLALDLRPTGLDQVLGNDHIKKAIRSFAEKDNWPNVFLFYGPPGCGKTTLALIVAGLAGASGDGLHEINASGENGVEAARELGEISSSLPFTCKRRVIILNEFHQFTGPAQEALKDPMEKNPAMWVLTTDKPEKVQPAIRSRASAATFEVKPLNQVQINDLIVKAVPSLGVTSDMTVFNTSKFLIEKGVTSPREILGILDQMLAGVPLEDCIHGSEHEPLYRDVASAILSGNWTKACGFLSQIKTADSRGMIAVVSAFIRSDLIKSPVGPRADSLATCLVGLDSTGFADGVAYGAVVGLLYKCAKALKSN